MNETRKEIIGLIEPYMNKELSEWVFMRIQTVEWENALVQKKCLQYFFDVEKSSYCKFPWHSVSEILWHYDITAVLKCIRKVWKYWAVAITSIWVIIWNKWEWFKKIWDVPEKPLNLYSEQEDKNLLELLKKLK